jgi:hypothetical protein
LRRKNAGFALYLPAKLCHTLSAKQDFFPGWLGIALEFLPKIVRCLQQIRHAFATFVPYALCRISGRVGGNSPP